MKACNSKRYVLFNFHFMYYSEFLTSSLEKIEEIKNKKPKSIFDDTRKVVVLETKEIFSNAIEANKKYYKTSATCILCCCKRTDPNRLTANGVHWVFFEDYIKMSQEDINSMINKKRGRKACKPVINLVTGIKYSSIEEASKATGVSNKTIRHSCKGTRNTRKSSGNWVFE